MKGLQESFRFSSETATRVWFNSAKMYEIFPLTCFASSACIFHGRSLKTKRSAWPMSAPSPDNSGRLPCVERTKVSVAFGTIAKVFQRWKIESPFCFINWRSFRTRGFWWMYNTSATSVSFAFIAVWQNHKWRKNGRRWQRSLWLTMCAAQSCALIFLARTLFC